MRFIRKTLFVTIILNFIFLGIFVVFTIIALLFWDGWNGKMILLFPLGMIFLSLRIASNIHCLKKEESIHRSNALKKMRHDKLAFQERQKINQQREKIPGQIDARLNKVLTSNLFYFRMLHSIAFIRLFVFTITSLIFWYFFNFRVKLSLLPGLIAGFLAGEIWQIIVRYRIAAIFEREFPSGTPDRANAIQHLNENSHAYWFALELLKAITNRFGIYK